jgi:methanogenic corrinoid protein MtbC1
MTSADRKSMQLDREFAATILMRGSRAIAAESASQLLDSLPRAAAGFGPDPFVTWQGWLAARVEELSAAVGLNRPGLFVEQTHWACSALIARGIDVDVFRAGLECLRKVVEEESPERARMVVLEPIALALAAFPRETVPEPPLAASPSDSAAASHLTTDDPYGKLASEYLLAVLEGDNRRARQMVLDAAGEGVPIRDLYLRVLCPAQAEVGRLWLKNELTIADEHQCSATTRRVMGQLVQLAKVAPSNGKTVATAAVAGNRHEIGQQAVADFFEIDGWRSLHLGADVPASALLEVLESTSIDLLALSAALAVHLPILRDTIADIRASGRSSGLKIIVGGGAFRTSPDLAVELGADAYCADAEQAVVIGRRLVGLD